jgi:hypothetical protein
MSHAPYWMRIVLILAGIYNLLWGAWAMFFPHTAFDWADMPQPNYPQLWQCIGMIVGVYGVGYIAAASDPYRHWPVVLVGFLGKLFGPFGFLEAAIMGDLPWTFGIVNITNDLIWWIPFTLILWGAWRYHTAPQPAAMES